MAGVACTQSLCILFEGTKLDEQHVHCYVDRQVNKNVGPKNVLLRYCTGCQVCPTVSHKNCKFKKFAWLFADRKCTKSSLSGKSEAQTLVILLCINCIFSITININLSSRIHLLYSPMPNWYFFVLLFAIVFHYIHHLYTTAHQSRENLVEI